MNKKQVVIAGAARTPIGDFGGVFRDVSPGSLAKIAVEEALRRASVKKDQVDEVILGNCLQPTDEPNMGRHVAQICGMPHRTTGMTIQRQCSSAMQALVSGYQEIIFGDAKIVVAGGVESMSTAPYLLKNARWGKRLQHGEMTDALWEMLMDPIHRIMMGETAENLAQKYNISREEQDDIACRSHKNALAAIEEGRFRDEIIPVTIQKKKMEVVIDTDEHPRRDISLESLAMLKPAFRKGGTVTAGNSSGLNDGAAAVVLMSAEKAVEAGIKPLGRIVSYAWAGVEPELMGYGPVPATKKALEKAGMSLAEIELVELNEAFAAQYLACEKLLDLNREIVNVNGSGVGLGHPVGCTGTRIVITLLYEMVRRGLKRGLATLCVGGGMGMSIIVERD